MTPFPHVLHLDGARTVLHLAVSLPAALGQVNGYGLARADTHPALHSYLPQMTFPAGFLKCRCDEATPLRTTLFCTTALLYTTVPTQLPWPGFQAPSCLAPGMFFLLPPLSPTWPHPATMLQLVCGCFVSLLPCSLGCHVTPHLPAQPASSPLQGPVNSTQVKSCPLSSMSLKIWSNASKRAFKRGL